LDFTIPETVGFYLFLAIGSLLPDIDHPESKLGRILLPISYLINNFVGHRTLTHSIFVITILFFASIIIWGMNTIIVGLTLGCMFHVAGDMLTPSGVCLLYPINKKRFKIPQ